MTTHTIDDALAVIREQLRWRGTSGMPQKYIVIDREDAQAILAYKDEVVAAIESMLLSDEDTAQR